MVSTISRTLQQAEMSNSRHGCYEICYEALSECCRTSSRNLVANRRELVLEFAPQMEDRVRGLRLLLVDDEPSILATLKKPGASKCTFRVSAYHTLENQLQSKLDQTLRRSDAALYR